MGRKAKGTVTYDRKKKGWKARVTCADGSRPWIDLGPGANSPKGKKRAQEKAAFYTERIRVQGIVPVARQETSVAQHRETKRGATHEAWMKAWIAERKKRGQTSTRENDSHYRLHIRPALGDKHVRFWTPEDMRRLCATLDDKVSQDIISWKMAVNIWATATKICKDAYSSKIEMLRVRLDNPAVGIEGPTRGAEVGKQYVYPSEFLQFVGCETVPLPWRRAVTLAAYLYVRAGELRVMDWADLDLDHCVVHVNKAFNRETGDTKGTKNLKTRRFSFEPELLPLLEAMHDESGGEGGLIQLPSERDMARGFRTWLQHSGVCRTELFTPTATTKAIVFHDTRATSCTWAAVRGDDPISIMHRAGHQQLTTTMIYVREAENLSAAFGAPFPPLPIGVVYEPKTSGYRLGNRLSNRPHRGGGLISSCKNSLFQRGGRDSNP